MWELGQEKGLWADQSAETWHDNFGYEQAEQQQWAVSERAEDLVQMKNEAEIVERRARTGEEHAAAIGDRTTLFRVVGIE
jgi:hypothetical protein